MKKNKAILFDSINTRTVFLCYLLKPFFEKIFFRYSEKKVFIPFFKNFFVRIGYSGIDGALFNKSYFLKKFLIKKYLNNVFHKKEFFKNFCKLINLDEKNINKLIFSFENFLYHNKILSIDTSSFIYSKKFLNEYKIIYAPDYISSFFLISQISKKKFKVVSFIAYFNIFKIFSKKFISVLFIFIINKLKKIFSKNKLELKLETISKNQVGYFPHKNLKYGSFFSKTFFYKNETNSIIKKLGIDTIFFEKTDKLSERYLRIFKKQKIILKGEVSKNFFRFFIKYLSFVKNNRQNLNSNKLSVFSFFLLFFLKIESFNYVLRKYNYKYFFFYNDYIIPNSLLISAAINKIKTISFQDRLTSYVYNNKIICDYYFTCGNYFTKIFKMKYSNEKLIQIGLLRSNLIDQNLIRDEKFLSRIRVIRQNKKIISLILTTSTSNQKSSLYGEDGTSTKTLFIFEKLLIDIEKKMKNSFFILIKFKDSKILKHNEFFEFERRLKRFDNVEIIKDKKLNSANIISLSDIVIGSQSTIIEESLMQNKFSFIFDYENFASTLGFYKYNKFYILQSINSVIKSLLLILNKDMGYIDNYNKNRKVFIEDYLSENGKINDFNALRLKILDIINEKIEN